MHVVFIGDCFWFIFFGAANGLFCFFYISDLVIRGLICVPEVHIYLLMDMCFGECSSENLSEEMS